MNNTPTDSMEGMEPAYAECPECRKDLVSGFEVDGFCSEACRNAALASVYETSADDSWDGETKEVPPWTWETAKERAFGKKGGSK